MKTSWYKYALILFSLYFVGCSKEKFAEYNTDPDAVIKLPVDYLLTRAIIASNDNDFEAYYDSYSYVSRWSRVFLQRTGNSFSVVDNAANSNNRYGRFFKMLDLFWKISSRRLIKCLQMNVPATCISGLSLPF